ncbi:MAG: autoantigen p27 domain-containing protein [Methanothrix sp.]|jgi:UPF0148 protein|nr:autoantigen p27 domain-containing protein [Methanothrix sp.]
MEEDEILAKITRLLEKGCTMLATHHDCGAPLFRCEGNVVCPVCSFEDGPRLEERLPADPGREEEDEPLAQDRAYLLQKGERGSSGSFEMERQDPSFLDDAEMISAKANLRSVLLLRMKELTAALQGEQDLDKLKKQMDCLDGLLRVIRSLKE